MAERYVIAYDLGTTGNKATMFDEKGDLIASTFCGYKTYYPEKLQVEQNPEDWWNAVRDATGKLMEKSKAAASNVVCLTFSGQMMGCVPVDQKANPIGRALIWADQRGVAQANNLIYNLGQKYIYNIVGHRPSASYSAAKIMWIKEKEPSRYKKIHKMLHAKDFIVARMTGNFFTDYSDASGTNLFDITKLVWSDEIINAAGINYSLMPKAVPSTEVVGKLKKEIADELDLKAGTPVVIGGGDGSCAAAGAGVIKPKSAYNYVGSSSWIGLSTEKPLIDEKMRTFNWVHVVPGMYSPTGTMQTAGGSYQWTRDNLCYQERKKAKDKGISPYIIMDKNADTIPPGSDNLLFLPYLMGERAPHWNPEAKGAFVGLTIKHSHDHMVRSVMEGVAFNLKIILDTFIEQGAEINKIRLIGGGAKGKVWRQIISDIYNREVIIPNYLDEATSMGAALTGGVGVGLYKDFNYADRLFDVTQNIIPQDKNREIYNKLYKVFVKSYKSLYNVYSDLHNIK